ncbi:SPW repeat domain-containing protein [Amycolatopsis keratiniphila]|uniref:SPW repeat domain-containing protein n=1 Tax=Amycolatopsis keratiniphila TaxID=129921 RepID=UPI000879EE33|nr:SPW repeat protein [Amycolatopsis keratiniphila]OLZ47160.1 hypothetical protein BS330_35465 [Amycolatopsis keratiniphila subsp. nogabecina]SDU00310.1 SPW repeat-containing protein [Amycolatopsis keratiniphila]
MKAHSGERPHKLGKPGVYSTKSAIVDAATFLAGLWLLLSPFLLDHTATGTGFNGHWNDGLVGGALLLLGTVSLVDPVRGVALAPVRLPAGGWLIVAPTVLGYNVGLPAPRTTTSDVTTGLVILALWVFRKRQP